MHFIQNKPINIILILFITASVLSLSACSTPQKTIIETPFCEGLAIVNIESRVNCDGDLCSSDEYGYIDKRGHIAFKLPETVSSGYCFSEGLAAVDFRSEKFGFINRQGQIVIPVTFDFAGNFSEGLAVVAHNQKYGYIDKTGTIRIPPQFDQAYPFSNGFARVVRDGLVGFIDQSGKLITSEFYEQAGNFNDQHAFVCKAKQCGFISTLGNEVIPLQYEEAQSFSDGLAPVKEGQLWGYINHAGEWVVKPKFVQAAIFSEGAAAVSEAPTDKYIINPKYAMPIPSGYIDTTGKYIIQPGFLEAMPFSEGMARVRMHPEHNYDTSVCRYVRRDGTLLPGDYKRATDFHDGIAFVTLEQFGKVKAIDSEGNIVMEFDRMSLPDKEPWQPTLKKPWQPKTLPSVCH
ncbi:MAG: WG repeat-containing protein [Candidatus Melainabacteria bacterium]